MDRERQGKEKKRKNRETVKILDRILLLKIEKWKHGRGERGERREKGKERNNIKQGLPV